MDAAPKDRERAFSSTWDHRLRHRLTRAEMQAARQSSCRASLEPSKDCRIPRMPERSRCRLLARPRVDSAAAAEVQALAEETALAADCKVKVRAQAKTTQAQDAAPIPMLAAEFLLILEQVAQELEPEALPPCPTSQFREARRKSSICPASALLAETRLLPDPDVPPQAIANDLESPWSRLRARAECCLTTDS